MNERIKELAEQAGYTKDMFGIGHWDMPECIHFAELVRQDEREACAKLCEDQIKSYMSTQYTTDFLGGYRERFASEQCAAAIRGRTE